MKFVSVKNCVYWWPVPVRRPDFENPGKIVVDEFEAQFRLLDDEQAKEMGKEAAAVRTQEGRVAHERKWLSTIVANWRGMNNEDGSPTPFELFPQALEVPWYRIALYNAYGLSLAGEESPTQGN